MTPQTWAESLTKQFDAIKGAQKYKQLAEQLGTDTKTVCAQMALAQKIIHDAAELEEAEAVVNAWTEKINYLQGIKTTSKEGLFVTTTIVSGGVSLSALSTCVSTLGEAGVVVVGGADCIVDVATTGSTIILGENHQVTVGLNDVKDKLAPVTAVTGLLTFEPAKLGSVTEKTGEQLSYIGDSLADLFYKGKILGIKVVHEKNGKTISAQVMEAAGQDVASLEAVLKAAGFSAPGNNKSIAKLLSGYEIDPVDSMAILDALASQMAVTISGVTDTSQGQNADDAQTTEENDSDAAVDVSGTYEGTSQVSSLDADGNILETQEPKPFTFVIKVNGAKATFYRVGYEDSAIELNYDSQTGVASFDQDNTKMEFVFDREASPLAVKAFAQSISADGGMMFEYLASMKM